MQGQLSLHTVYDFNLFGGGGIFSGMKGIKVSSMIWSGASLLSKVKLTVSEKVNDFSTQILHGSESNHSQFVTTTTTHLHTPTHLTTHTQIPVHTCTAVLTAIILVSLH